MARFVAAYKSYRAVIDKDTTVQFSGGVFETNDPRLIEALSTWGYPIVSVEEGMKVSPMPTGPSITPALTTKSREETPTVRRPGRPKGSRNKAKTPELRPEDISHREEFAGH